MTDTQPTPVWELAAELGEGPVWVERDQALWFVDIKKQEVHRFDPASGDKRSWNAPEQVGFVFPAERGGFVAGLQSGLYHFDERSGAFELIARVEEDKPGNRLNDAIVDPQEPPMPGKIKTEQAIHFAEALLRGDKDAGKIIKSVVEDKVREVV